MNERLEIIREQIIENLMYEQKERFGSQPPLSAWERELVNIAIKTTLRFSDTWEKDWECLICKEKVDKDELCKCMRDYKESTVSTGGANDNA